MKVDYESRLIIRISGAEIEKMITEHVAKLMNDRGYKHFDRAELYGLFPDTEWHSFTPNTTQPAQEKGDG